MTVLSFGGLPQTPDTATTGSNLSFGLPSSSIGTLAGQFGFSTGVVANPPPAGPNDLSQYTSSLSGYPQPTTQGNKGIFSGLGLDMGTILTGIGAVKSAISGGNPASPPVTGTTPASYSPAPASAASGMSKYLVIGAMGLGALLLLRG